MNSILNILSEQKEICLKETLYNVTQIVLAYNNNKIEGSALTEE